MGFPSPSFPPNRPGEGLIRPAVIPGGDIELGNVVVSVNGMRIFNGSGAPSATGNYHNGDKYTDYTAHIDYVFSSGAWVQESVSTLTGTIVTDSTTVFDSTAANSVTLALKNTASGGEVLKFIGNGATTPSKSLQVFSGNFYVVNDALNHWLLKIDDSGNLNVGQDIPRVSINSSGFCQLPSTIATLGSNQALTTGFVAYLSITLGQAGTWIVSFSMGIGSLAAGDQVACVVNNATSGTSIFAQGDCSRSDGAALMAGTFIYTVGGATTITMYGINVNAARGSVFAKDTITGAATGTWLDAVQVA